MNKNKLVNLLFIFAVLVIVLAGWAVCKSNKQLKSSGSPEVLLTDPQSGSDQARVTIIEFADFQCPYSKKMNDVFKRVEKEYGDRVRIVWKDFPLTGIHEQALSAAEAGRCAQEQQKFWQMHDLLFQNQSNLNTATYISLAEQIGLDKDIFSQCLTNHDTREIVNQNIEEGQSLGVTGTPYFYVNKKVFQEVIDFGSLKTIIDSEL